MLIIPSTDYAAPSRPLYAGLLIGLAPSTQSGFGIELQRTSESGAGGAASTAATSIAELDPVALAGVPYFDDQPADGQKRFYRARHIADGYTEGAWTAWTTGHLPAQFSEKDVRNATAQVTGYPSHRSISMTDEYYAASAANPLGSEFSTSMYLPSTYTINVGTTGTPQTITKTIRVPHAEFMPMTTATDFVYSQEYLRPNSTSGTMDYVATILVPPGVTLTEFASQLFRTSSSGAATASVALYRVDAPSAGAATLALLTHSGSSWQTGTAAISQLVTSTQAYVATVSLRTSTSIVDARLADVTLTYTMPSYDKGY